MMRGERKPYTSILVYSVILYIPHTDGESEEFSEDEIQLRGRENGSVYECRMEGTRGEVGSWGVER